MRGLLRYGRHCGPFQDGHGWSSLGYASSGTSQYRPAERIGSDRAMECAINPTLLHLKRRTVRPVRRFLRDQAGRNLVVDVVVPHGRHAARPYGPPLDLRSRCAWPRAGRVSGCQVSPHRGPIRWEPNNETPDRIDVDRTRLHQTPLVQLAYVIDVARR